MFVVIGYMLAGALVGAVLSRVVHVYGRQNRLLFAAIGMVVSLLMALLAQMNESADLLRAAFQSNKMIAASFFFAVCCAFAYQGLQLFAPDCPESLARRLSRLADFTGAMATGLVIVALVLWNVSLRG